MKKNKILFSIGTMTSTLLPVVVVVSCENDFSTKDKDKKAVIAFVQALKVKSLQDLGNPNKLNTSIKKLDVLKKIKASPGFKALKTSAQKLISENNISLDTKTNGTLKVTIKNHGDDKLFTITGFKTGSPKELADAKIATDKKLLDGKAYSIPTSGT
jgi:hypothetical protein